MTLSKRDTNILVLIGVLLVSAGFWQFIFSPLHDSYVELSDNLEAQVKIFEENKSLLDRRDDIELSYRKVEATFPTNEDGDPRFAFREDVDSSIDELLPNQPKKVEPAKMTEIPQIKEYEKLFLEVATSGNYQKISQLLKGFDQKGFWIAYMRISQPRGIDDAELSLQLTLDRFVKIEAPDAKPTRRTGSLGGYR